MRNDKIKAWVMLFIYGAFLTGFGVVVHRDLAHGPPPSRAIYPAEATPLGRADCGAPLTPPPSSGVALAVSMPYSVAREAASLILWCESRNGADPKAARGQTGPAGERGPAQWTPIWLDDYEDIYHERPDPYGSLDELRFHIWRWLCVRACDVCETPDDYRELYRRGRAGYLRWKGH